MILSRPPGDEFSFSLFSDLTDHLTCHSSVVVLYLWAYDQGNNLVSTVDRMISHQTQTVILCIRDKFTTQPYDMKCTELSKRLIQLAKSYPRIRFVVCTALENLLVELGGLKNINIIEIGGDITNHYTGYQSLDPVLIKNTNSDRPAISLNRHARPHRVMAASWLHGNGYLTTTEVTFLDRKILDYAGFMSYVSWDLASISDTTRHLLCLGFTALSSSVSKISEYEFNIYQRNDNNNVENFQKHLRSKYHQSFIEIISETTFEEPTILLTEKTLNSIYGCNFPIFLSSPGTVSFLRSMGMDVFDDIIDHRYDEIMDPALRLTTALSDNQHLFSTKVVDKWLNCRSRFLKNVDFARTELYNFYRYRALAQFDALELEI